MKEELIRVLEDIADLRQQDGYTGYTTAQSTEILKLAELRRIANILERVVDAMDLIEDHLSDLSACVTEKEQLCVTGEVTTYEP